MKDFFFSLVFYKSPLFSFYIFSGLMVVIHYNDVTKVPPFLVSILILKLLQNYSAFGQKWMKERAFSSISLSEICSSILLGKETSGSQSFKCQDLRDKNNLWLHREIILQKLESSPTVENHSEYPFFHKRNCRAFSTHFNSKGERVMSRIQCLCFLNSFKISRS